MPNPEGFRFDGIGTRWEISTPRPLDASVRARLLALVERYDGDWSRFRSDSTVGAMARQPGRYELPPEAADLGRLYRSLYDITGGAMTPLIGGSLERLGYDADYSLRPAGSALPAPRWEDVLAWDGSVLTTSAPLVLDIGAAGKGQLVDLLAIELRSCGVDSFVIDASGDLLHRGPDPVSVALEHPYDPARAIGTVPLAGGALCASASNRRAWGDGLHHVLDGTTGLPVSTAVATWTMAESTMVADALATALFFVPGSELEQSFDFSWLTVFSDGSAAYSAGFEGTLFS
ncbi:FAD:protein FMN transferase [Pseudarthrobacter cellobiosi]|uniref:FAD:protein FMN transferase n=1 Tax=Pseudarthrobacter cellobiosi TaxID=2953654 RepID=UPI00208F5C46|nr:MULTISPECIES: FAD:protein FMN transferase [unclassified Pseudarthrobacter]MCO4257293.1 FAD:protein FMN transferase [Pseudarthrobacter sp. HLT1-5]MCO4273842.1 FAD:protein FMN transferase [Pseudarthrobacter sp. HLT3-5]